MTYSKGIREDYAFCICQVTQIPFDLPKISVYNTWLCPRHVANSVEFKNSWKPKIVFQKQAQNKELIV